MSADTPAAPAEVTVPLAEGLAPSREAWEKATAAVLRKSRKLAEDAPDADAWARLTTTTLDGIAVTPLGTPEQTADLPATGLPGQAPFTRGTDALRENRAWDVRAWFTDPDGQRTADGERVRNASTWAHRAVDQTHLAPPMTPFEDR